MTTVVRVDPRAWNKDGETIMTYWVALDDREKDVPCYDSRAQDLKVGEALPDGWTIAQSKAGKDYLKSPAKQGSARREYVPRFTDTEAGWRANDERVDRRAALAAAQAEGTGITTELASRFYTWLRATVPAPGIDGYGGISHPTARGKDSSTPKGSSPAVARPQGSPGVDSSGSLPARGESDPTSAPRVVVSDGKNEAVAVPVGGAGGDAAKTGRVGADTSSTDAQPDEALASGSSRVGGSEDRGQPPADMGKVHGGPCLHLKGVFEKRMANGDRVSYCSECKTKLEVVKAS